MIGTLLSPTVPVDTLELYRWAVQDPETHAAVLRIMYERLRPGRTPTVLREDFSGSSAESVAWVALGGSGRRAVAVDLDGGALAWARRRAARILGPHADRVEFVASDVMEAAPPRTAPADIISVLNFSIAYLHRSEDLRAYFAHARRCIADGGLVVVNIFGGPGAERPRLDRHRVVPRARLATETAVAPFEYRWEQRSFDTRTRRLDCRIHFGAPDPSAPSGVREVRDAFVYDWRLWTVDELTAAMREAGFGLVQLWRHTHDPASGSAGVFLGPSTADSLAGLDRWSAYIIAGLV